MQITLFLFCIYFLVFCEKFVQYGYKGAISSTFVYFGETINIGNAYYHCFASILPVSSVIFCYLGDIYDSSKIILGIFFIELTGIALSLFAVLKNDPILFKLAFFLSAAGCGGLTILLPGLGRIHTQNKNFFFNIGYFVNAGCFLGYYIENYFTKHYGHQITYVMLIMVYFLMLIVFLITFFTFLLKNKKSAHNVKKKQNKNDEFIEKYSNCENNTSSTKDVSVADDDNLLDITGSTVISHKQMSTFYIFLLYIPLIPYFSLKEQYNSSFKALASKLVDFVILKADQVQIMNPLFYVITVPVVKLLPFEMPTKIVMGYCMSIISFFICLLIEKNSSETTSVLVMVIPFLFLSFGEVLCYTTNQEYAYEIASTNRKFFVLSFIRLMGFFGNIIVTRVYYSGICKDLGFTFTIWGCFGLLGCFLYTIAIFIFEKERRIKKLSLLDSK